MEMSGAIRRGYGTISLNNGKKTRVTVARAMRLSQTRTERGWKDVGTSLRKQMDKHPK